MQVSPNLTQVFPERELSIAKCFQLRSVDCADPEFNKPRKVEKVLSSDVAEQEFLVGKFMETMVFFSEILCLAGLILQESIDEMWSPRQVVSPTAST